MTHVNQSSNITSSGFFSKSFDSASINNEQVKASIFPDCSFQKSQPSVSDTSVEYERDSKGNVLKEVCKDIEGNLYSTKEYTRDADGNCIKLVQKDADGKITLHHEYSYHNGMSECIATKKTYEYVDGNMVGSKEQTYDSSGRLTEYVGKDADGNILDGYEKTYDKYGNNIKSISIGQNGSVEKSSERIYDENGNYVGDIYKDSDGNEISIEEYYDL